jgi:hypothetical protein
MTHDPNSGAPAAPEDAQQPPPARSRLPRPGRLDPQSRARIGRGLRLLYAEALTRPVPERLERLVAQLGARSDAQPDAGLDARPDARPDAPQAAERPEEASR